MAPVPRHSLAVAIAIVAGGLMLGWHLSGLSTAREVEAGFWFEDVSFRSARLGGALTAADLSSVDRIARAELTTAFSGLRIRITDNRTARYQVRVVQQLRDERLAWPMDVAGQSRGMTGFGGSGQVNFGLLASGALVYAPADLGRGALVDAIGRGIGRSAAHEFAHQLLPHAAIDRSRDRASYDFYSAGRAEHYFGELRWDVAGPLLRARWAAAPFGRHTPRNGH